MRLQRCPVGIGFFLSRPAHVRHKEHVVVIRDRDTVDTACSTRAHELCRVGSTLVLRDAGCPGPLEVPWRVNLQVAAMEVCAFIHEHRP